MVYVFFAEGFEEIEAITTVDILRRLGIEVAIISIGDKKEVMGAHGIVIETDGLFSAVEYSKGDAFVLPGGMPGTNNLQAFNPLRDLFTRANQDKKVIAAICAAPKVFGAWGFLQGKKATCYPGFEDELKGATLSFDKAVADGHVITSRGAGTAGDFAFLLGEKLGKETENLRKGMIYA